MSHNEHRVEFDCEYPDRHRVPIGAAVVIIAVLAIGVHVLPEPSRSNVIAGIEVTEQWNSWIDRILQEEPARRFELHPDGHVESGELQNGERHGEWANTKNGMTTYSRYHEGRLL